MRLDHIAVSGSTLEEAAARVEEALRVAMQPGGQHERFGTHNRLLGLADGLYLEAIAVNPAAPRPDRPRWFGLDRFTGAARLTNWVCAVDDIAAACAGLPPEAGAPLALSRNALRWKITVPDDGMLPFDNLFPALISWRQGVHPSKVLTRSGCRLRRLVVSHPDADDLRELLAGRLADDRVAIEPGDAALRAEFDTLSGPRVLE